jgi:hypothetical protein
MEYILNMVSLLGLLLKPRLTLGSVYGSSYSSPRSKAKQAKGKTPPDYMCFLLEPRVWGRRGLSGKDEHVTVYSFAI